MDFVLSELGMSYTIRFYGWGPPDFESSAREKGRRDLNLVL
jgi:hypothetical protein